MKLAFAIYRPTDLPGIDIRLVSASGDELLKLHISWQVSPTASRPEISSRSEEREWALVTEGWLVFVASVDTEVFVLGPGSAKVMMVRAANEVCIGTLDFAAANAAPLTPERIAAIPSDPNASKA